MIRNARYFRLGLFVVTAVAIAIVSIIVIVGPSLFSPKTTLETYFQFSISGLQVGSPVKFRGIPVGQVEQILLSTEAYPTPKTEILSRENTVAVVRMEIELEENDIKKKINSYIAEGLRVQTQLAGITGSLYLSIDFLDPKKYPADRIKFNWKPKYTFIPSAPSLSNEIVENVKNFLASLDDLRLEDSVKETLPALESLIQNLDHIFRGLDAQVFSQLGSSLGNLFSTADAKINEFDIKQLNDLISQLSDTASTMTNFVHKSEVNKLVANLSSLSQNLNKILKNNNYDIRATIQNLNKIAENLKTLTRELDNSPSALFVPQSGVTGPLGSGQQ